MSFTIHDDRTPLAEFLAAIAARQPTPGGGSAAALAGALAAAIGEMSVGYSLGKKGLESFAAEFSTVAGEMQRARQMMLRLMVEDQVAYEALTRAQKLPSDSPERAAELSTALAGAIAVPQAIVATSVAILRLAERVVDSLNYHLLSDLAVCADLAMTTARCGSCNVRVNLKSMPQAQRKRIEDATGELVAHALALVQRISPRIWARHERGK